MANKNIQIKNRSGGTWDNLYPKTLSTAVNMQNGQTLEQFAQGLGSGGFESGQNSNGRFIKFDDGTLICYTFQANGRHTLTADLFEETELTGLFRTEVSIVFPVEFVATSIITGYITRSAGGVTANNYWTGNMGGSSTGNKLAVFKIGNITATGQLYYMAIGRWK